MSGRRRALVRQRTALQRAIDRERPAAAASFALGAVNVESVRAILRRAELMGLTETAAGARWLLSEVARVKLARKRRTDRPYWLPGAVSGKPGAGGRFGCAACDRKYGAGAACRCGAGRRPS